MEKHWICNREYILVELRKDETAVGVDRNWSINSIMLTLMIKIKHISVELQQLNQENI